MENKENKQEYNNFLEIYEDSKKIKIPKIQRNYVQGLNYEIRTKIISDIFNSLNKNEIIDLDVIYGTLEGEYFIPIDGQQRLTTLYLLHWYIYEIVENKENEDAINFEILYETQKYTQEFFETLKNNTEYLRNANKDNKDKGEQFSKIIKNSIWYYKSKWDNDTTVQASLQMLDEIVKNYLELKGKKIKNQLKNIQFSCNIIEAKDEIDPNELYIKMNSRGKQLSNFEDYKAYIEKLGNEMYEEDKMTEEEYISFCVNMNNKWPNIINSFYDYNYEKLGDIKVEEQFYNIIRLYIIFFFTEQYCIDEVNKDKKKKITELLSAKKQKYDLDDEDEKRIKDNKNNFFENLTKIMDNVEILHQYKEDSIINISELWKDEIENVKDELSNLLKYYAIMKYFEKVTDFEDETFYYWLRIIRNLIEIKGHIQISAEDNAKSPYYRTFKDIKNLADQLEKYPMIRNYFVNITFEDSKLEVNEHTKKWFELEKTKAELSEKSEEWKNEIIASDKIKYLTGRTKFIFDYAKNDIEEFKKYRKVINEIFNDEEIKDSNLLQRAMLCDDEYFYFVKDGRFYYTFLNFDDTDNTNVWKVALNNVEDNSIREKFKEFIDNELINTNSTINKLNEMIDNYNQINTWKYYFIKQNLFSKANKARILFGNDNSIDIDNEYRNININDCSINISNLSEKSKHWDFITLYIEERLREQLPIEHNKDDNRIEIYYRGKTGHYPEYKFDNSLEIKIKNQENKILEQYVIIRRKSDEEKCFVLNMSQDCQMEFDIYYEQGKTIDSTMLKKFNRIMQIIGLTFETKE